MKDRLEVFKEEPGFVKLFKGFKEKYRSLGRVGGTVSLKGFSSEEIQSIAGFLGQPAAVLQEKGSVSLLAFERELGNTGFTDMTLKDLLEAVLGEAILTKVEEAEQERIEEQSFYKRLMEEMPEASWWLEGIMTRASDTRWIRALYQKDKHELLHMMLNVYKAFKSVPAEGEYELLPFFSQRTTGNPHYFDSQEAAGKLLVHCLYADQIVKGFPDARMPRNGEELNELLGSYGILRDDLWNFATCQGLLAFQNGVVHQVWRAAADTQTVMNVPMKELSKLDGVRPAIGHKVWIVENSGVCSALMDALPQASIICTHGQFRAAGWKLLDFLAEQGCTLYYSGDLDPEGILIADRMKKRYKDQAVLWRMDAESYIKSLSEEDITDRMAKLDKVDVANWAGLIELMRNRKGAGYQEALAEELIGDIKKGFLS